MPDAWSSERGATISSVMLARAGYRFAILFGARVVGGGVLVFGCSSSDRPAASAGTGPAEPLPTFDASPVVDAGGDREIADSASDHSLSDDGHCLTDQPAPTIDGGFDGGDEAGIPICPTTGTCVSHCNDVVARYKLGVAQVAVTCIRRLPDCSNVLDVRLCVENALAEACQDTTAPGACAPLVLPCDPKAGSFGSLIDENGCEGLVRGLNPTGRGALASCVQRKIDAGTCPSEVDQCTSELQP
jgi:hypothetical protein